MNLGLCYNILCCCVGFSYTFLFCYYATKTSDSLIEIANFIYNNTDWYKYPNDLKKYSILIMARAQCIFYFTGFKIVRCTLQNFMKVIPQKILYQLFFTFNKIHLISTAHQFSCIVLHNVSKSSVTLNESSLLQSTYSTINF